jgi:hypothetical protein
VLRACGGAQQCAAACACLNEQSHQYSFQPCIFELAVRLSCTQSAACCGTTTQCAAACVHCSTNRRPCQPFIPAVHLDCSCTVIMYTICCVLRYYSSALLRMMHAQQAGHTNHSVRRTSLIVAVRLSCTQSAACCGTTAVRCVLMRAE